MSFSDKKLNTGNHARLPASMTKEEIDAWQEQRIKDLWRVFRIVGEFTKGFETLSALGPCVSIYGSARTPADHPDYHLAETVARKLVERGFGVITGGGPGIMEAANKGAFEAGGLSVGLNIVIPHEQHPNPYVAPDKLLNFDFFFVRKVMLHKYAQGFIVLPGGYGTMDELFEALTLIQTRKATPFPIILMGKAYWQGLVSWLRDTMLASGRVSPEDLELFALTDDPDEAVDRIDTFYRQHMLSPNF
ncbi:TIGR00730 family Rossman fold protein [Rhodocaloribacter litoris]|uniref:LOG family protein n=1 Tax=Rhodocaloribacter litoris TaxID=2558931 RepID=UPI001E2DD861|nr:TIGR00730 family Rossman fold protein [Rhodocaloribacter litoris]QXD16581.1 TIGR00730 family Rossman fold protein [Rhodocaloribacter litoris]